MCSGERPFTASTLSKAKNLGSSYLECSNLQKKFGSRKVVDDVSLKLERGKVVGLLGPNGAGKTTVFYMLVGLLFPDSGNIRLDGVDVTHLPLNERAHIGLGYLAQEPSLFRKLSVYENIAMAGEAKGLSGEALTESVLQLIRKFGLEKVMHSPAQALSGGERRRTEIARCLAISPHFILLDEPFAGIDPLAVKEIQSFIAELKSHGIGILITDHNVRETLGSCDYCYLLREGKIFLEGKPAEIAQNSLARKVYLGDDFKL